MKNIIKMCLVSLFGLSLLQAIPNVKGDEVKNFEEASSVVSRGPIHDGPSISYPTDNQTLMFGTPTDFLMKKNVVYKFKCLIPKGCFVAKAESSRNVSICVDSGLANSGRIFDNGSYDGSHNGRVKFTMYDGNTVTIYAKVTSGSLISPATVTMSVRRPKANALVKHIVNLGSYTMQNTIQTYEDGLQNIDDYYNVNIHAGVSANEVNQNDLFNSEVVLFNGGADINSNNNQTTLHFQNGDMTFPSYQYFQHTELVLWGAYGTAMNNSTYSPAEQAVELGAKCSIGFLETNWDDFDVWCFCANLLDFLAVPGRTVTEAIEMVYGLQYDYYGWVGPYVKVYGDPNLVLVGSAGNTVSNGAFSLSNGNPFIDFPTEPGVIGSK